MNKAQIQDAQVMCIECGEGITNPICPECLAKEMEEWKPGIGYFLSKPESEHMVAEGVRCLFCGKTMSICAHCYSEHAYEAVTEEYLDLGEDFIDTFNFGLREEFGL